MWQQNFLVLHLDQDQQKFQSSEQEKEKNPKLDLKQQAFHLLTAVWTKKKGFTEELYTSCSSVKKFIL